jgi:3-dehydroquinate dehydratase-2
MRSNVHTREEFRHCSFVCERAEGGIAGFGSDGYQFGRGEAATLLRSISASEK